MTCITIDSGTGQNGLRSDGERQPGMLTRVRDAALRFASACRNRAALAMMSERDLDDLGVLPWEVRADIWREAPESRSRRLNESRLRPALILEAVYAWARTRRTSRSDGHRVEPELIATESCGV